MNSEISYVDTERQAAAELAARKLDHAADYWLQWGFHHLAEKLAHQAEALRNAAP